MIASEDADEGIAIPSDESMEFVELPHSLDELTDDDDDTGKEPKSDGLWDGPVQPRAPSSAAGKMGRRPLSSAGHKTPTYPQSAPAGDQGARNQGYPQSAPVGDQGAGYPGFPQSGYHHMSAAGTPGVPPTSGPMLPQLQGYDNTPNAAAGGYGFQEGFCSPPPPGYPQPVSNAYPPAVGTDNMMSPPIGGWGRAVLQTSTGNQYGYQQPSSSRKFIFNILHKICSSSFLAMCARTQDLLSNILSNISHLSAEAAAPSGAISMPTPQWYAASPNPVPLSRLPQAESTSNSQPDPSQSGKSRSEPFTPTPPRGGADDENDLVILIPH